MLWSMKMPRLPADGPVHEVQELLGLFEREPHRGLVEDDDLGLEMEGSDDGQTLALSAREPGHRCVGCQGQ